MPAVRVLVTGAAGQIAYSLLPFICSGSMLGNNQRVILHLLDIPPAEKALAGVVMELEDLAFELVDKIVATTNEKEAFSGVDIALLVGARPRGPGMERKDLLKANAAIFQSQGRALNQFASPDVKVVVVGNPANTNAAIASRCAPLISKANFTALTRLDQNRATAMLAARVGVPVEQVRGVFIWGNHSATQYPDWHHATVGAQRQPIADAVRDVTWLEEEFIPAVQKRGAAVIKARKLSSAMSAAKAIRDHMHDWLLGSKGLPVSMGVMSEGQYGTPVGVIYSFPVICRPGGSYSIVEGLDINTFSRGMMQRTGQELQEERDAAFSFLNDHSRM